MKRNEIDFDLTPKQLTAWKYIFDSTTTELGYGGAARGGKTWLGVLFIIAMCCAYPDTGYAVGRKELKNLKRTTLSTFFKACAVYNFKEGEHFRYDQQSSIITFTNGSQIYLLDLAYQPSDPLYTWLGGFEPTMAWIDESNELPFEAIAAVKSRVGNRNNDKYKLKPFLLETFNPDKGHVYNRYYKPYKGNNQLPYRRFIPALPKDNPFVPKSYLQELERADKVTRERLLYGNFEYDDDPTRLMDYDKINDLFTNAHVESGDYYITADIARMGSDKSVIIVWDGFRAIYIKTFDKNTTVEVKDFIKGLSIEYKVPMSRVVVDEDGVGGGVKDELMCMGFVNNSRPVGRDNYKNLKSQCYFTLSEYVNKALIYIDTKDIKIQDLIKQELDIVKVDHPDRDGKLSIVPKDKMKEWIGRSPDFADALMMRMFFNLKKEAILI